MRFAVCHSARDRRADAGRRARIDGIHIERHPNAGRALRCDRDGLIHDATHAAFVERTHRQRGEFPLRGVLALRHIEVAGAHQHHVLGLDRRPLPADSGQSLIAVTEQMRERHPVHIAGSRRSWRMQITVCVYPDHADLFTLIGKMCRRASDRSGGQ